MSDPVYELKIDGIEKLQKLLKKKPIPYVRIGVLGSSVRVDAKGTTNATVGAVHEFGSPTKGIPPRSFLRVPLIDFLGKRMDSSGFYNRETMEEVIRQRTLVPWLKKMAVLAEAIVAEAFATGGFGKWPKWKNENYSNNANQLLVDTGQLRNSITSEVVEEG